MSSDFTYSTCNALVDPGSEFWNLNLSHEVEEPPHVLWAQALACNWDSCGKTFEFATYPTPSCCSSCDVEFKGGRTKWSVRRKALQSLISKQLENLLPPSCIRYQMLSDFLGVFVSGFVLAACHVGAELSLLYFFLTALYGASRIARLLEANADQKVI